MTCTRITFNSPKGKVSMSYAMPLEQALEEFFWDGGTYAKILHIRQMDTGLWAGDKSPVTGRADALNAKITVNV